MQSGRAGPSSAWVSDGSDDDDDTSRLLKNPVRTYETTEEQALRDHEGGLDRLGEAIKRQKFMANEIATEVDVHNEIIDDIDNGMTRTRENLDKNVRNIKLVTKKSSTCCLWFIIVILAAIILALAIL